MCNDIVAEGRKCSQEKHHSAIVLKESETC